jgi:hypothetical protein
VDNPHRDGKSLYILFYNIEWFNLNIMKNLLLELDRYHVPRSWLNPRGNYLVVFEEWGGDPNGISLVKRTTGSVCADIYENQPTLRNNVNRLADLWCPIGQKIFQIKFASYGLSQGTCGNYREGSCHAHKSYDAPQRVYLPFHCQFLLSYLFHSNNNTHKIEPCTIWFGICCSHSLRVHIVKDVSDQLDRD